MLGNPLAQFLEGEGGVSLPIYSVCKLKQEIKTMKQITATDALALSIPERIQLVEDIWDTIAKVVFIKPPIIVNITRRNNRYAFVL